MEYAAQFPHNGSNSQYWDVVMFKSSDDWGSCNIINHLCHNINITSNTHIASNDPDSNKGHLNIAALIDGKVYIADVGYDSFNNINKP